MDGLVIGALGIASLFVLIALGVHIAVATGIVGIFGTVILIGIAPSVQLIGWLPYSALASFTWVTLPLFILMGEFAIYSGASERAFAASYRWLASVRGGVAMSVTATSALFAACSGSSIAATAMMTRIALPELRKLDYNDGFSAALIAASGSLAALIPPSMLMIVYSMLTQQSLVQLLLAGFIPGIVSAVLYMIMIRILALVRPDLGPVGPSFSWAERGRSLVGISGIAVVMMFVVGGMYSGVFTASEAAAAGAMLTLVMALSRRALTRDRLTTSLSMAGVTTSSVFMVVLGTLFFSKFLSLSGLPAAAVELAAGLDVPRWAILAAIIVLYLLLGMFLEVVSMMAVTLPTVLPIIIALDYDPIWFGVIVIKMSEIAAITPPMGLNVYSVKGAAGDSVRLEDIFKNILPFLVTDLLTVALFIAFPEIVLWLPSMML